MSNEIAELDRRVRELADRAEITELVVRGFAAIDERQRDPAGRPFDEAWARASFTEDVRFDFPPGSFAGLAGAPAIQNRIMDAFGATQHLAGVPLIELDGDRARVRWDAVHTHHHREPERGLFVSGGYYEAEAVRTPDGWRFRRMALHVTWTTGEPPRPDPALRALMAATLPSDT
ncbi:nuclear transport factor 2 family protein [Actinomadura miaoliensis]|uniref:Nuclear transport factor 2 family protein n=1 Tax=Actinomadura miaoliensis TaxID=430685 RepID=A0ABP7WU49_9ACTN